MPVKKFKDPFKTPEKSLPPISILPETRPEAESLSGKKNLSQSAPGLNDSSQTPSPSKGLVLREKQKVYPNGNKGWANLEKIHANTREKLKDGWASASGRAIDWLLQGERLEAMLAESKLKDVAVFLGISTEKVLLLEGQPTQIIGTQQQAQLDKLGPALMDALQKRGLGPKVTLTERTATIDLNKDEPRTPQPISGS